MVSDQMSPLCEAVPDCPPLPHPAEIILPHSGDLELGAGLGDTVHGTG